MHSAELQTTKYNLDYEHQLATIKMSATRERKQQQQKSFQDLQHVEFSKYKRVLIV